jgi:hypothetical protein
MTAGAFFAGLRFFPAARLQGIDRCIDFRLLLALTDAAAEVRVFPTLEAARARTAGAPTPG